MKIKTLLGEPKLNRLRIYTQMTNCISGSIAEIGVYKGGSALCIARHKAKERNDEFIKSYSQLINKFEKDFTTDYCDASGAINWTKIVELNSATNAPKKDKDQT